MTADQTAIVPADVFLGLQRGYDTLDPPGQDSSRPWERISLGRTSPLVMAAAPLLSLCGRIKSQASHADVDTLRLHVLGEIDRFERRITPLGLSARSIRAGKYALCATIDDIVLNTPWGGNSVWTTRSMVGTLFSETWGGDRFFDLLTQLKRDPGNNIDLIELLYYCISLGFEGKYRIAPRGASELVTIREDLYRLIRNVRGDFEQDISPHWRGTGLGHRGPDAVVPPWITAAVAAAFLLLILSGLALAINQRSDGAFAGLAALPPAGGVDLIRAAPVPPPPPPPEVAAGRTEALRTFLEPEIREGLVSMREDAQTIGVRIAGDGMFSSGRADVLERFKPLLGRIGQALNDQPGEILVTGHTDSLPIRSLKFPSNWDLSLARARAAASLIGGAMADPSRLTPEGKDSSQPVASNDTDQGRKLNRRIELVILKAQ
ncbi:type IVB secretion system protein IcmH/DotU (plasmid) [Skermanella rosea]|uniref:type IVB secretion system protein IcmH/DotU n=1 Tax=Skermanella rosea TaxID=1817965 RepID=UPI0019339DB1|nr:type IVB secretion system protein IcmH/DotU [Skermanella rosea]UEM07588.1 type IVB secretion system protein IcmH/DotU [Skermanella rosea]